MVYIFLSLILVWCYIQPNTQFEATPSNPQYWIPSSFLINVICRSSHAFCPTLFHLWLTLIIFSIFLEEKKNLQWYYKSCYNHIYAFSIKATPFHNSKCYYFRSTKIRLFLSFPLFFPSQFYFLYFKILSPILLLSNKTKNDISFLVQIIKLCLN